MKLFRSCLSVVGGVAIVGLLLAFVLGPAAYVELSGKTAPGVVTARHEDVRVRYSTWTRSQRLEVRYSPADTEIEELATIPVNMERYDEAQVGDTVRVRYMPWPDLRMLGEIAAPRLADQGPLGQLWARVGGATMTFAFIVAFLALLAVWGITRRGWLLVPIGLLLVGFAMYTVSDPPQPAPPGPQQSAHATVKLAHEIDRISSSRSRRRNVLPRELLQPYTVVALEFVPQGATQPVVAVDLVDVDSVPALAIGAELPISYSAADPRWVRIEGAQRTYFWKNLLIYAFIAGVIVLLMIGVWLLGRRRRLRRQSDGSGEPL